MCILQGPVAARWSIKKDEPVKELLGTINGALIQRLLDRKYNGDASKVPVVAYLAPSPKSIPAQFPGVVRTETDGAVIYEISSQIPDTSEWLEALAGDKLTWLRALIASRITVQGTSYVDNPIRRTLAPRPGQKFVFRLGDSQPSVTVYGAARSYGVHLPGFKALEIMFSPKTSVIKVTIFEERRGSCIPLVLQFWYHPKQGFAPIHEISADRNIRIKQFYWKLWYGDKEVLPEIDIRGKFFGPEITISAADIERFCAVVGNRDESFKTARNGHVQAPMDFAIVTGWQVCRLGLVLW